MKKNTNYAALLLLAFLCSAAFAAKQPYRLGPAPDWVAKPLPLPDVAAAKVEQGESDYVLVDRQVRVAPVVSRYARYVEHLVSQSSVDSAAQISIEIDPEHEFVTLHEVRVLREGKTLDKLPGSRRSLLTRESSLEDGLIDGRVTLHVLLHDVRVGDILDYAYTVDRRDPIAERSYYDWHSTQWTSPVRRFRLRVLHSSARPLKILDESKLPTTTVRHGKWLETTWNGESIVALPGEEDTPRWYFRYPRIELSEFADWNAVREWSEPLYGETATDDPAIEALVKDIASKPDESERVLTALRFVQDEIRYTGLEIGAGAYRPTQPGIVLQRRFGDCKDKVLLFVTLLRALGIEAYPALVNTRMGRGIEKVLPSASAFDHVIAKVKFGQKVYWLDATASGQGGDLLSVAQADFGVALVLDSQATALEEMPRRQHHAPLQTVKETFDFRAGVDKPAVFNVVTEFLREEADGMRVQLRDKTVTAIGKEYFDYYSKRYDGLRMVKPMSVRDDRTLNRVVFEESYEIDSPFGAEDAKEKEFVFEAFTISDRMRKPVLIQRTTPLARRFPVNVEQEIVAFLPKHWNIANNDMKVENGAFTYESKTRYRDRKLSLSHKLRHTSDHVPQADLKKFVADLDKVRHGAYYTITDGVAAAEDSAPDAPLSASFVVTLLVGTMLGAAFVMLAWRLNVAPRTAEAGAPVGLLGWMIIPVLSTVLAPLVGIVEIAEWSDAAGSAEQLSAFTDGVRYLILALMFVVAFTFAGSFVLPWLLFKRSTAYPYAFVIFIGLSVVSSWLAIIITFMRDDVTDVARGKIFVQGIADSVSAAVWITYMFVSQRVRATFVRSHRRNRNSSPDDTVTTPPVPKTPDVGPPLAAAG